MAGGSLEEELAEGIILPPSKIPKLELPVAQSSQSQPIEAKKVAYLRDTELVDLLPIKSNIMRLNAAEQQMEGSASPFIMELLKDLEKPLDSRTIEEIRLKEIRLYLENEGRSDLAMQINSSRDFDEKVTLDLRSRFEGKGWYFDAFNDVGGLDDYQLLCLGPRGNGDDLVAGLCNKVGNTLDADLSYVAFCTAVFAKLEWNDTAYVGFEKAVRLKSSPWYYNMKTLIIPWVLNEWTTYRNYERELNGLVELHCNLWDSGAYEGGRFSEMLYKLTKQNHDPCIENTFRRVCEHVQQSFEKKPWMKLAYPFIKEYFQKLKPVKPLEKSYLFHVKKKITKAVELGIIKKDNKEDPDRLAKFLKEIEDGYPDFFRHL